MAGNHYHLAYNAYDLRIAGEPLKRLGGIGGYIWGVGCSFSSAEQNAKLVLSENGFKSAHLVLVPCTAGLYRAVITNSLGGRNLRDLRRRTVWNLNQTGQAYESTVLKQETVVRDRTTQESRWQYHIVYDGKIGGEILGFSNLSLEDAIAMAEEFHGDGKPKIWTVSPCTKKLYDAIMECGIQEYSWKLNDKCFAQVVR